MRKVLILFVVAISYLPAKSQRNFSLAATGNFDFATSGLGANDAGFGLSILSNVFTKQRLQLKIDGDLDHCFGDKILVMDTAGNHLPSSATLLAIRVGPEFLITDNIALSALYGYTTYNVYGHKDGSATYKLAATSYLGKIKKTLLALNYSRLTGDYSFAHFWE